MKPQLCSPLGRILVLIFGLFASAASPFRADAATCTTSDLASGSAAFVAHSTGTTTSGSVFLVNVSATPNTIQCSISVGKDPTNLAVSPDASLLFVENDADGTVTVVNLTDGTINTTITLTGAPMTANLAVSPDNSKVYVVTLPSPLPATPPAASLYVISLPSLGVSAAIPVTAPATPTPPVSAPGLGVAFSPDATLAFIATEGLTYIVTTASNAVSATSIPANIAEGRRQESEKDFARFLRYALNSSSELEYHLILAHDIKAISEKDFRSLITQTIRVRKMLYALLKVLASTGRTPPAPARAHNTARPKPTADPPSAPGR